MSDDLKHEETQAEFASRAESKRHSRCWRWVIAILGAVILGGAGAFLVFSPASPMHEWALGVLWPAPEGTEQVNPQAQGQLVPEEEEEHCRALTLHLVFSPGEGFDAPEVEAERSADADMDAEAATGEPSPADVYREAMHEAVEELKEGTAKTSAIVLSITPVSYVPVEGRSQSEPLFGYRTEEMAKRVKAAEEEAVAASFKPSSITIPPAAMLSCVCYDPGVFDVSLEAPVVDSHGFAWELAGGPIRVELLDDQDVELLLTPVALAALSTEEFAALKVVAGAYADALVGCRDAEIAIMLADEVDESEVEDPDNPEDSTPGSQGGAGNSSGSHSSGQNPGNGGSPSSGDGGGTQTHTHTWEMRIVIIGSHEETEVVPAWDETIHHNAVYNDWTETISRCSTCQQDIT
ncbi:MAG: hypothetical protein IKD70_04425, partial [Eggerthellaceae bacterium]|nr:hypothetical protein [Eggerthellaceae bacterium]